MVSQWIDYKDRDEFRSLDKKSKIYYIIERIENEQIEKKYKDEENKRKKYGDEKKLIETRAKTGPDVQVGGSSSQQNKLTQKEELDLYLKNMKNRNKGTISKNSKARETERSRYASKISEDKMLQLLRKFNQIQLENAFGSVLMAYHNQDQEEKAEKLAK